jgi:hypothetical protein
LNRKLAVAGIFKLKMLKFNQLQYMDEPNVLERRVRIREITWSTLQWIA